MNIVMFCKYRVKRMGHGAERIEKSVILPGGIWTCTNPGGHCSCVSTCGLKRMEHSAESIEKGVIYDSGKRQRRPVHLLSA